MRKSLAILATCALLSACAESVATRSGFLSNYSAMQPVNGSDGLLQQAPAADFDANRYTSVFVEPAVVMSKGVKPEDAKQLASVFEDALRNQLGAGRRIVHRPGPGTLHVRAAIIKSSEADVDLNIVTSILAIPLSEGSMAAEAEVIDGGNGMRVAAMSWTRDGGELTDIGLDYTRLGHARSGLRAFAVKLVKLVDRKQVSARLSTSATGVQQD